MNGWKNVSCLPSFPPRVTLPTPTPTPTYLPLDQPTYYDLDHLIAQSPTQ